MTAHRLPNPEKNSSAAAAAISAGEQRAVNPSQAKGRVILTLFIWGTSSQDVEELHHASKGFADEQSPAQPFLGHQTTFPSPVLQAKPRCTNTDPLPRALFSPGASVEVLGGGVLEHPPPFPNVFLEPGILSGFLARWLFHKAHPTKAPLSAQHLQKGTPHLHPHPGTSGRRPQADTTPQHVTLAGGQSPTLTRQWRNSAAPAKGIIPLCFNPPHHSSTLHALLPRMTLAEQLTHMPINSKQVLVNSVLSNSTLAPSKLL